LVLAVKKNWTCLLIVTGEEGVVTNDHSHGSPRLPGVGRRTVDDGFHC